MTIPFAEKKTRLRGIVDVVSGCYPGFLIGREIGEVLPVFHFHDVTTDYLEPYFRYLAENNYTTVTAEDIGAYVREGVLPEQRSVALCFDDAWLSLYTVVEPLLKKYSLKAITYVAPSLIDDPTTIGEFVSWSELKELHEGGLVDIQSHTWSHAKIFSDDCVGSFIKPGYAESAMSRPAFRLGEEVRRCLPAMLGCPIYETRSRMSDALRYLDDASVRDKCMRHVRENGGSEFFDQSGWREQLIKITRESKGRFETESERDDSIRTELVKSKSYLEEKLSKDICQVCMPWGIGGKAAERLAMEAGYDTMVADEMFGKRSVVKGGNPYRIMRLKHNYIYCLPGSARKTIYSL